MHDMMNRPGGPGAPAPQPPMLPPAWGSTSPGRAPGSRPDNPPFHGFLGAPQTHPRPQPPVNGPPPNAGANWDAMRQRLQELFAQNGGAFPSFVQGLFGMGRHPGSTP